MSFNIKIKPDFLVFREKYAKNEVTLFLKGPREIIGIPGKWLDGVIQVNGTDSEFLTEVIQHLEEKQKVDRIILKLDQGDKKTASLASELGFTGLGLGTYVKPINPTLKKFLE